MWWLWVAPAQAHELGLSYVRVDPDSLTLVFAAAELTELPALPVLTVDGAPCALGEVASLGVIETDGFGFRMPLSCPEGDRWTLSAPYLDHLGSGHLAVVSLDGAHVGTLRAGEELTFGAESTGQMAARFVELGVEHVVTGWDHLAFLLGLLLVAKGGREVVGIVTGFTLAHSITLSLAALGVIALPESIVEPAIAASVVWVGIENWTRPPVGRRLALTFLLGLIHGFGFAGLLGELGLPRDHALLALFAFNVGVELGQLAIVALVLPVLLALRKREAWVTRAVPALSGLLALAGGYWFFERVLGG